jgi:hypothetical protein
MNSQKAIQAKENIDIKCSDSLTLWVNEQLDPIGLIYACVVCHDEYLARVCHKSFEENLTKEQKKAGWISRLRTIHSWDELPVCAQGLS